MQTGGQARQAPPNGTAEARLARPASEPRAPAAASYSSEPPAVCGRLSDRVDGPDNSGQRAPQSEQIQRRLVQRRGQPHPQLLPRWHGEPALHSQSPRRPTRHRPQPAMRNGAGAGAGHDPAYASRVPTVSKPATLWPCPASRTAPLSRVRSPGPTLSLTGRGAVLQTA